jgi:hypothetical protein
LGTSTSTPVSLCVALEEENILKETGVVVHSLLQTMPVLPRDLADKATQRRKATHR